MAPADLKKWRVERGLTQEEAGRAHGVSQEFWAMMENGVKAIPDSLRLGRTGSRFSNPHRRGPYQ